MTRHHWLDVIVIACALLWTWLATNSDTVVVWMLAWFFAGWLGWRMAGMRNEIERLSGRGR